MLEAILTCGYKGKRLECSWELRCFRKMLVEGSFLEFMTLLAGYVSSISHDFPSIERALGPVRELMVTARIRIPLL